MNVLVFSIATVLLCGCHKQTTIEHGIERGCHPSPLSPCVYPPDQHYEKEYTKYIS